MPIKSVVLFKKNLRGILLLIKYCLNTGQRDKDIDDIDIDTELDISNFI